MPEAIYQFPPGFLWGTATASHQVEGQNTNNNWYAWECEEGRILNGDKSGLACDWWGGRWKEDLDRARSTGQNAHRMSIEWSRIQPAPDRWDENALDHYRDIIRGMTERKLKPMVTLHHFTDPLWLTERGAWEDDGTPELFVRYVSKVVEALQEYVELWVTINEPNVYTYGGYMDGGFPPGKNETGTAFIVLKNMVRGHALAYKAIHDLQPQAQVGIAPNYRSFAPARSWMPPDKWMANFLSQSYNDAFPRALVDGKLSFAFNSAQIPEAKGTMDFFGINYYTRDLVKFVLSPEKQFNERFFPEEAELSDTGFLANIPEGLFEGLKWARGYGLPIYVTENGVENVNDDLRPRYLIQHIHQMWRAVNFNWNIQGYFEWSLVDNFEWERGWTQRFGLWGLDVDSQIRLRRTSVDIYERICKENAISSRLVEKYTPEIMDKLFPGFKGFRETP